MPSGRWWIYLSSRVGSDLPGQYSALDRPRPLDNAGHLVRWKKF
jgi:hypothetical protein